MQRNRTDGRPIGLSGAAMAAQNIAIDAVLLLTGCDRVALTRLIRRLYHCGVRDPKRFTFKGLQFAAKVIS
ncbi:hypothetical protein [Tardiphaga sp.]|uniref:hypothetical protein n=1 Tax=Tardiphaga sp. TaxID=1926292 RepID=UPI0019A50D45|nr:hypothetical protein [Tardiphaga sp.]MBC7578117.1 hypothetical protein [Tardiphaga sp.]